MTRRHRTDFDESDIRIRPNRRGTRPRSKERPRHADAVPAQVLAVDRGRYTCLLGGFDLTPLPPPGRPGDATAPDVPGDIVIAMTARELGRTKLVVGDLVMLVGDTSGVPGSLARVVRLQPRRTLLLRSADDTDPVERPVVANADQLAVVTALAEPLPRPRMVDRCLVAAYDAGLDPLLVLTKADLADPSTFLSGYAPLGVPHTVTHRTGGPLLGLDDVRERLRGRVTALIGHSGVGKSTLVNALVPGAGRATGAVNDVTGRGRLTSTSARALRLPDGGWVIDTPGVRSFGLAHINPDRIIAHFSDLAPGLDGCPRGCTHDEPECGLDGYVAGGGAGPAGRARLDSLRRLLHSRSEAAEPWAGGPATS
ncbi:MAG: ribosome small subunit-dependent GTPase A [Kineosporiaceae bacterium]